MDECWGPHRMTFREGIPPLPTGPKAADWLPGFAGFSWLAYGAHDQLAVSNAPSTTDTKEAATGRFFQQILGFDSRDREWVRTVAWSPQVPSLGILAAGTGNNIHVFGPKGLSRPQSAASLPELPLTWERWEVLRHSFEVSTFSWTFSGDGLLAVGSEIMMWQHQVGNLREWICLWRVQVEHPQHLCAATFSAKGFVASATGVSPHEDGSLAICVNLEDKRQSTVKQRATIWSWEDGSDLEEVELMHPQQVLSLQWRPSKVLLGAVDQESALPQRPILLTMCSDGAVRLWLEVDSGRSRLDRATGRESTDRRLKSIFFVSAVIEVNRTLCGQLGHNVFVTWATDIIVKAFADISKNNASKQSFKKREVAPCEWLVGLGPNGSISLWSLHCLDDVSPSRCPRVFLWEHGFNLLPDHSDPSFVKCVVQRPEGALAEPPSSLEVFENLEGGQFRWLRIWPPVSAIGRGGSKAAVLNSGTPSSSLPGPAPTLSPGKKSIWSVASADLHLHGHPGEVISLAVHPNISTRLAASLDETGTVLVWLLSSCYEPQFEIENLLAPFWKLGGQQTGRPIRREGCMNVLAWAPIVFPGGETCLFVANLEGVSCFLTSKDTIHHKAKPEGVNVVSKQICTLPWSVMDGEGLDGICCVPTPRAHNENVHHTRCTVLGTGNNGTLIVVWQLLFASVDEDVTAKPSEHTLGLKERYECISLKKVAGSGLQSVLHVDWRVLGSLKLDIVQRVISIAAPAFQGAVTDTDMATTFVKPTGACHVVTGCADGIVRFWRIASEGSHINNKNETCCLQCVGLLKAADEHITSISLASNGQRVATSGKLTLQKWQYVCIWQTESCSNYGQYRLEDKVVVFSQILALTWSELGNGLSTLAVALQDEVKIYIQCRSYAPSVENRKPRFGSWICIASMVLDCNPNAITWGPYATLIVASGSQIWASGLTTSHQSKYIPCEKKVSKLISTFSSSSPSLSSYKGVRLPGSLEEVMLRASSYNTLLEVSRENLPLEVVPDAHCTLCGSVQTAGALLPDYHPTKILWYLNQGEEEYARTCIRHLVRHLIANMSALVNECAPSSITSSTFHDHKVPLLILRGLQRDGEMAVPESSNSQYGVHTRMEAFELSSNDRYSFLDTRLLLDNPSEQAKEDSLDDKNNRMSEYNCIKRAGRENLTKNEADTVLHAIEQSHKVPGLTNAEKIQLLAVVDTLADIDGINRNTQRGLLDQPGQRFWLAARYSHYEYVRKRGNSLDVSYSGIDSKPMAWALHSESKDLILDLCLCEQPTWSDMRALGLGYWYTDPILLRTRMEKIARAQFLVKRDPKECMLLYLALNRRSVLTGLFKLSQNEQDKHLYEFLVRDFKDEKHRGAALKNAYVLMGKHRHELAASFFLLGGDIASAVTVCVKNLGDPQLGLVICRLLEGVDSPIGVEMITKQLIPTARAADDYWLVSLLQWLVGCKLEAVHELTKGQGVQKGSPEDSFSIDEGESEMSFTTDTTGTIVFDPDVGDFCTMLASNRSLQSGALAAEASKAVRRAILLTTYALSRSGLPLQALEQLKLNSSRITSKLRYTSSLDRIEGGEPRDMECELRESLRVSEKVYMGKVGTGWILQNALGSIEDAASENLALQWAAHLLQDHPFWLNGILTWSQLIRSLQVQVQASDSVTRDTKYVPASKESGDIDAAFITMSDLVRKADKLLDDNFCILATRFSVDLYHIFSELGSLSWNLHHPYALCRLRSALESALTNGSKYPSLASRTTLPLVAVRCMKAVCKDAPWVLARAVLACGGHVPPVQRDQALQRSGSRIEKSLESVAAGVFSSPQLQTSIQYSLEIMLLAIALETESNPGEATGDMTSMTNEKKIRDVTIMLAYVLTVAAAWLGRCAKALLLLVRPTVQNAFTSPEQVLVQFDAAAWSSITDQQQRKGLADGVTSAAGSTSPATHIVEDDVWRVLGVSLWSHVLSYCRKQLSGTKNEASYSSYGRVSHIRTPAQTPPITPFGSQSPVRSPPSSPGSRKGFNPFGWVLQPSSPTSKAQAAMPFIGESAGNPHELISADDGCRRPSDAGATFSSNTELVSESTDPSMPLLSSLACIAAGLRSQLASHIGHTLDIAASDPLVIWLWGNPHGFTPGDSVTLSSSSDGFLPEQHVPRLEVADNGASMELWKLLVVKENVLSALGLEGVVGPKITAYNNGKPFTSDKKSDSPSPAGGAAGSSTGSGISSVLRDGGKPPGKMAADTTKDHPAVGITATGVFEGLVGNLRGPEGKGSFAFQPPEEILHLSGELFEAICINSCDPEQAAIASNHKGIIYLDLKTHGTYSHCDDNLWGEADWPKNGWAGSVSTPSPAVAAPSLGLGSKVGVRLGVGGSAGSLGPVVKPVKDSGRGVGFGVPGYGGMGAWGWGWEEWEGGVVDPPATVDNVHTKAMAAHPLRPFFLVGSDNTHVYLWEFGKSSATATYGVLPATNVPPLYVIPSVSAVKFDRCGHRFASAALDGSVSIWQLEVGGRSNVCPTDSRLCFSRLASDVTFVGASGSILATTGATQNGDNLVIWDTLAPPNASRAVSCHEGGARCLSMFDNGVGGSSSVPLLITGGKTGDIALHDFRYIAGGKPKQHRAARDPFNSPTAHNLSKLGETAGRKQGQQSSAGMTWYIPYAHSGGVARVVTVPGTSLFLSASKDGDVKLWDVNTCEMVDSWPKVHERHMFLRHNSTGFGAIHGRVRKLESLLIKLKTEAAVTDLQVLDVGFVTCGADGIVKLFRRQTLSHAGDGG